METFNHDGSDLWYAARRRPACNGSRRRKHGHGIAEVAALAGYDVALRDIEEEFVQGGYDQIEWSLGKLAEKDRIGEDEADAALDRVEAFVDLEDSLADADVVVEVVPEKMAIKKDVYDEVVEYAPEEAVFVTNTSSLSITELSEVTDRPERFCGMHFFNPPVRMDLVEVISGKHTSEDTLELIEGLAESMGKNRSASGRTAPGSSSTASSSPPDERGRVDRRVRRRDDRDGRLHDEVRHGAPDGLVRARGPGRYRRGVPRPRIYARGARRGVPTLPTARREGRSRRAGEEDRLGVYDYENGGAEIPTDAIDADVRKRLLAVMANEVAGLAGNDVADAPAIDRAVMLGAGFPDGPAKLADSEGLAELVDVLDDLHEETGEKRYEATDFLREAAEAGSFHGDESADTDGETDGDALAAYDTLNVAVEDRIGHVEIDRPHRMNTISGELLDDELSDAIDRLDADDDDAGDPALRSRRPRVLRGRRRAEHGGRRRRPDHRGRTLAAGPADVRQARRVGTSRSSPPSTVTVSAAGWSSRPRRISGSPPSARSSASRSTTSGCSRGGGGTQRLARIVGEGRAKEIIFTADRYEAETLADYGFINEVVPTTSSTSARESWSSRSPPARRSHRSTRNARCTPVAPTARPASKWRRWASATMNTDDLMEGVTAFMGDGEPEFEGKGRK